jgi:hypothetical protein
LRPVAVPVEVSGERFRNLPYVATLKPEVYTEAG